MLKDYDQLMNEHFHDGVSENRVKWELAREMSRRNDLLEVEMLCRTAEAVRNAAKSSLGELHDNGWMMAEELALMAHKKITTICGLPDALLEDGEMKERNE